MPTNSTDLQQQINAASKAATQKNVPTGVMQLKHLMGSDVIKQKFNDVLKDSAPQFMSSIINLVNSNQSLQDVDQTSVISSALVAATLNLPIDQNLGYAWVVPFKDWKRDNQKFGQFQLGYKGYIQLALRTGQYKHINAEPVYEGEIKNWDRFTETFDRGEKTSDKVVGYLGYFELVNGFSKTVYWSKEDIEAHRIKFSKARDKAALTGVWKDNYDAMATKTVIRNLLSKWGILSVEMQKAAVSDEQPMTLNGDNEPEAAIRDVTEFPEVIETKE
ncbi:recombinase RecT (plasmid) [Latilactobacillus curvatus]|uniref:recombinase RecT n=1 Tax=Latilactobacillus curvatus TaxID=28038 RepID=UPI0024B96CCD|nr:recombinase RecT [Latilactobacillus curvatus]WHQ77644.1 recombinase RecT [Latilactobacillus curvatus]WHQ79260.1 recombinase RecT [Latilactobacillus curvatus]